MARGAGRGRDRRVRDQRRGAVRRRRREARGPARAGRRRPRRADRPDRRRGVAARHPRDAGRARGPAGGGRDGAAAVLLQAGERGGPARLLRARRAGDAAPGRAVPHPPLLGPDPARGRGRPAGVGRQGLGRGHRLRAGRRGGRAPGARGDGGRPRRPARPRRRRRRVRPVELRAGARGRDLRGGPRRRRRPRRRALGPAAGDPRRVPRLRRPQAAREPAHGHRPRHGAPAADARDRRRRRLRELAGELEGVRA